MLGRRMGNCGNIANEQNQQYFGCKKFGYRKGCGKRLNRGFGNKNRNYQKQQKKES
jgi:hypothetical protein